MSPEPRKRVRRPLLRSTAAMKRESVSAVARSAGALERLHGTIASAGIPIHGLDSAGNVHFRDEATPTQREQAAAMVKAFDWGAAEQAAVRRGRYERLVQLQAVKAAAEEAADEEVGKQVQEEIAALQPQ